MTLFDALGTPQYFQNYEALLAGDPLPHGNLRGRKLDKNAFFKDHSDYEVLLRNDIPEKYWEYFDGNRDDDDDGDSEIEIGRGGVNISPQRRSIWSNDGIKETKTDELNLNLGNLKLNNLKQKRQPIAEPSESFKLDFESDSNIKQDKKVDFNIKSNKYKKLPNKTKPTELDNHLETLTNQLVKENAQLKYENESLINKLDAANDIIRYETDAYESIREKLKIYVMKYKKASKVIQRVQSRGEEIHSDPPIDISSDRELSLSVDNELNIPEVDQIDTQIAELKAKKSQIILERKLKLSKESKLRDLESKLTNSTIVNINIPADLAKLLAQKMLNMESNSIKQDDKQDDKQDIKQEDHHHKFHPDTDNCPFCKSSNEEDDILKSTNMSKQQWDSLLQYLTERIGSNLATNPSIKDPEVW